MATPPEPFGLGRLLGDESAFFARYQRVVDLSSGATVGQAASLHARLRAREISPGELFQAARAAADIEALDRLGRTTAIRGASGWLGKYLLLVRLVPEMVDRPAEALTGLSEVAAAAGLSMRQVAVEVLLSGDREAVTHLARVITRCRGAGCRVVLTEGPLRPLADAVGVLLPDVVKLTRSAAAANHNPGEAQSAIRAGHAAGATVLAFGVETASEADRLRELGADWGQGYLYGRPRLPTDPG